MPGEEDVFDLMAGVERVASDMKAVSTEAEVDKLMTDIRQLQNQSQGLQDKTQDSSQKSALGKLSKELEEHMAGCTAKKAALISGEGMMNVQVACRIRPSKNGSEPGVIPVSRNQVSVNAVGSRGDKRKTFDFSEVFGPQSTQEDLFNFVHRRVMLVLEGEKVCLCGYGQTGSGKSYTITGSLSEKVPQKGIYQRALDAIFLAIENDAATNIELQIVQICNETIIDLCSGDLKQLSSADLASTWPIKSSAEGSEKFKESMENRAIFLSRSGVKRIRSHLVISIFVRGRNDQNEPGCLQLVDLSGSERVGRTEVTVERLEEAKHVNNSLRALGDALSALTSKPSTVALKTNKLTEEGKEKLIGARKAFSQMVANDPSRREREVQMRIAARSALSEKEDMEKDLRGLRDELNLTRRSLRDMESKSLFRHSRSTSVVSPGGAGSDASSREGSRSGLRTSRSSSAVSSGGNRMNRNDGRRHGIERPYAPKGKRLSIAFEEPDTPGSVGKQMKNVGSSEVR